MQIQFFKNKWTLHIFSWSRWITNPELTDLLGYKYDRKQFKPFTSVILQNETDKFTWHLIYPDDPQFKNKKKKHLQENNTTKFSSTEGAKSGKQQELWPIKSDENPDLPQVRRIIRKVKKSNLKSP